MPSQEIFTRGLYVESNEPGPQPRLTDATVLGVAEPGTALHIDVSVHLPKALGDHGRRFLALASRPNRAADSNSFSRSHVPMIGVLPRNLEQLGVPVSGEISSTPD